MSSWSARGAEILFLAMKRIKASTATYATAATMIYSDRYETVSLAERGYNSLKEKEKKQKKNKKASKHASKHYGKF